MQFLRNQQQWVQSVLSRNASQAIHKSQIIKNQLLTWAQLNAKLCGPTIRGFWVEVGSNFFQVPYSLVHATHIQTAGIHAIGISDLQFSVKCHFYIYSTVALEIHSLYNNALEKCYWMWWFLFDYTINFSLIVFMMKFLPQKLLKTVDGTIIYYCHFWLLALYLET